MCQACSQRLMSLSAGCLCPLASPTTPRRVLLTGMRQAEVGELGEANEETGGAPSQV